MTRLLFLGLNYAPEEIGIGLYSGELVDSWVEAGNTATVVTTAPYYPQWKVWNGFPGGWSTEELPGVRIVRCPIYVPTNPTALRRIIHHLTFAISTLIPMLWQAVRHRPDVVMTVAPSLIAAPVAWLAAKLAGARSWLHVQDFEVEAATATGLVSDGGAGILLAGRFERTILRAFDTVSTISPQMCAKLREKGVPADRVVELRNWAGLDDIRPLQETSDYRRRWNIETPHVALYSGNIANKQGIEIVLEAAQLLQHREDLTFVICGEGPNRSNLERAATGLPNVQVHDLQPREGLSELLGLATVHLLPQKGGAADLVLPSKLTNMLASGRPVVATASPSTGLYDEIEGVGVATPPEDARAFAAAIEALMDDRERLEGLGVAARNRAEERWSRSAITAQFIELATRKTEALR